MKYAKTEFWQNKRERNIDINDFVSLYEKDFKRRQNLVVAHTQENVLNCCTNWSISIRINYFIWLDKGKGKKKKVSFHFRLCTVY